MTVAGRPAWRTAEIERKAEGTLPGLCARVLYIRMRAHDQTIHHLPFCTYTALHQLLSRVAVLAARAAADRQTPVFISRYLNAGEDSSRGMAYSPRLHAAARACLIDAAARSCVRREGRDTCWRTLCLPRTPHVLYAALALLDTAVRQKDFSDTTRYATHAHAAQRKSVARIAARLNILAVVKRGSPEHRRLPSQCGIFYGGRAWWASPTRDDARFRCIISRMPRALARTTAPLALRVTALTRCFLWGGVPLPRAYHARIAL